MLRAMSRATVSISLFSLSTLFGACADDGNVGMGLEQGLTAPSQSSTQTTPTTNASGSGAQSTSSAEPSLVPSQPGMMANPAPTTPPVETAEPELDPTVPGPEMTAGGAGGDGASLDMGGNSETTDDDASDPDVGGGGAGGADASDEDPMNMGGMGGDGVGGMGGGAGEDTMSEEPMPSAACGSGAQMPNLNLQNTLISVPSGYDGITPVPVVIAFHAAGNGNDQMRSIIGSTFQDEYIMLYPKSGGNEWNNQADSSKVDAIFDALDAGACYDKNRVFAAGHSSGAQFIVQRLCAGESRWRAVSPVASSVYCSSWDPIPALVIHGIGDREREAYGLNDGDGEKDIVPYRTSNSCSESFTPVEVDGCMSGGVNVDPGCRDFDDCVERTRWCQHTDPQYDTSHHGVPCFGARVMKDFFDMYR